MQLSVKLVYLLAINETVGILELYHIEATCGLFR